MNSKICINIMTGIEVSNCIIIHREILEKYTVKQEDYSMALDEAFLSDYGYTFEQFCKVIMGIINCRNEREHDEVFVENKDSLIKYLMHFNTGLTSEVVAQVIKDISLIERKDFLKLPSKFRKEDAYPLRFNRAYSFNRRPVIIRGNDVIWGLVCFLLR